MRKCNSSIGLLAVTALAFTGLGAAPKHADDSEILGTFALWDEQVPWPELQDRQRSEGAVEVLVHRACAEYRFLHDNAVVWQGDTLFAAWYNCPRHEMQEASAIRGRRFRASGRTWSDVEVIADDWAGEGILYVPVAFLSHGGTLYAYITNMVGADLVVNCEVFALDEATDRWESRGGLLSTGQRYLVWNVPPESGGRRRNELVIGVSRPGQQHLTAVWQIRHGHSTELGVEPEWSYPYAVEHAPMTRFIRKTVDKRFATG